VHLIESWEHGAQDHPGHLDHVAFRMTGLEELLQQLEAHGIPYRRSRVLGRGITQLFFKDPVGTGLEAAFDE
jgi:hypothetical protein